MRIELWLLCLLVLCIPEAPVLAAETAGIESETAPQPRPSPKATIEALGPRRGQGGQKATTEDAVETEDLFGFTLGSDTDKAGSKSVDLETVGRFGKASGSYSGLSQKLNFGLGLTNDLSFSVGVLGDYHRVRNVPDLEDVSGRYEFNGLGGEVRYRFLDRATAPFGMTLHVEPSIRRIEEESGEVGRSIGSENKLIFDRELIRESIFGAVNLLYDLNRFRERGTGDVERSSNLGVSGALTYQIASKLVVGGEARYLRSYDGFGLDRFEGDAFFLGPTFYAQPFPNSFVSFSYQAQLVGREVDGGTRSGGLNLRDFERHQFRLKIGFDF